MTTPTTWAACHAAGMTAREACTAMDRSECAARGWATRHGKPWKADKNTLKDEAVQPLFDAGMTAPQAAAASGFSDEGLRGWAKRKGLVWPAAVTRKPAPTPPPPAPKLPPRWPTRTVVVQIDSGFSGVVARPMRVTLVDTQAAEVGR